MAYQNHVQLSKSAAAEPSYSISGVGAVPYPFGMLFFSHANPVSPNNISVSPRGLQRHLIICRVNHVLTPIIAPY
jgi:hypothetical protein